ncbi:MAG TPA: hypothetical protein VLK25_12145 [Allosphingosinicella sp.]|nr:hypothetical protein [Allosphingosinicella sp.]
MIFWGLVILAAAPLIMGAILFFMLRRGVHHRLHERRMTQQHPTQVGYVPEDMTSGWSASDNSFSGGGGDFGGGGATGSWESGGGDFGGGGASGDWGSSDSGGGDSGGGSDSGGGDSGDSGGGSD